MNVCAALNQGQPTLSFEFFPPKTEEQEKQLFETISLLKEFKPDFVSVTYGAMGQTKDKTFFWAEKIKRLGLEPVVHLTLIGFSDEAAIARAIDKLAGLKIENVLALRGDPPDNDPGFFKSSQWGKSYARELVGFIKGHSSRICVGVAGYPEKHPAAQNMNVDIQRLKEKISEGAEYVVTQLFFDNQHYFSFVDKCRQAGITVPIIPGIMPITSFKQIQKMTRICGATIPGQLAKKLADHQDDKTAIEALGIEHAIDQCRQLLAAKVPGIHFFVMNQAGPISKILKELKPFRR